MNNFRNVARLAPRYMAGTILVIIAAQKLAGALGSGMHHGSLLALCVTDIRSLDIAHVSMLALIALYLFMGIRTRVVAAFALTAIGVQVVLCTLHFEDMASMGMFDPISLIIDAFALAVLMASLVICSVFGGGAFALYRGGWDGFVPH